MVERRKDAEVDTNKHSPHDDLNEQINQMLMDIESASQCHDDVVETDSGLADQDTIARPPDLTLPVFVEQRGQAEINDGQCQTEKTGGTVPRHGIREETPGDTFVQSQQYVNVAQGADDGFHADAKAVADELDGQPPPAAAQMDMRLEATSSDRNHSNSPTQTISKIALPAVLAKKTCCLLSLPLTRASASTRDLVGWIGITMLFNGVACMSYAILKLWHAS